LAFLAGRAANPSLGLRPTGGVGARGFPGMGGPDPTQMAAAAMMQNTMMYMAAAANASVQQQFAAAQLAAAAAAAASQSQPAVAPQTPVTSRAVASSVTGSGTATTPSLSFSPWGQQYRGAPAGPKKDASSNGRPLTETPLDLCIKRD